MTTQDPVSTVVNCISLKASPESHADHIRQAASSLYAAGAASSLYAAGLDSPTRQDASSLLGDGHDATIISSTGESIPTNRSLLSLASPFLRNLLASLPCCTSPTILLPDYSTHALKHLVSIITHGFTTSHFRNGIFKDVNQIMDMAKLLNISITDLSYEKDLQFENKGGYDYDKIDIKEEALDDANFDEEILAIENSTGREDKNFNNEENGIKSLSNNNLSEQVSSGMKKPSDKSIQNCNTSFTSDSFPCEECGETFTEMIKLNIHKLHHCNLQLSKEEKTPNHNKSFLSTDIAKEFACPICPRTYSRKHNLNQHMNIHNGLKPYKCLNCGKGFSTRLAKKNHFIKCLSDKESQTKIESNSKGQQIKQDKQHIIKEGITKHVKRAKDMSQNEVEVNINLDNVGEKVETHFQCKDCLKSFLTKRVLDQHVMNSCQKNHKCPFCSTKFFHAGNIKRHVRNKHPHEKWLVKDSRDAIDLGENNSNGSQLIHKCSYCSKSFLKEKYLKVHMKKCHIGMKIIENKSKSKENSEKSVDNGDSTSKVSDRGDGFEYTCDECGKRFLSQKGLTKHLSLGICFKFHCSLCPEKFKEKEDLDWHTDICHETSDIE